MAGRFESRLKEDCVVSSVYAAHWVGANLNLVASGKAGQEVCRSQNQWVLHNKVIGHSSEHKTLSISWSHYPIIH